AAPHWVGTPSRRPRSPAAPARCSPTTSRPPQRSCSTWMAATTRWAPKRPKIEYRRLVAHLEAPAPDADLDAAAPRLEPDRLGVDALDLDRSFEHELALPSGEGLGRGRGGSECGPRRRLGLVADDR